MRASSITRKENVEGAINFPHPKSLVINFRLQTLNKYVNEKTQKVQCYLQNVHLEAIQIFTNKIKYRTLDAKY